MSPRATNLALLVLLLAQVASGFGGFLVGEPSGRWVFWAHSIGGLALVVLLVWKWRIVLGSFARRGRGLWAVAPAALGVLFLSSLATGLLWSTTGLPNVPLPPFGFVSGLTLHVVLSLALVPLFLLHLVLRWPGPRPADFATRRAALRHLFLLGGATIAWQAAETATRLLGLTGAERRFTGSREQGSYSGNAHPVTNWLTDTQQSIDADRWHLLVTGGGQRLELTYNEILSGAEEIEEALLDCTGGWYTIQRWRGIRLERLLPQAGGVEGARSVLVRSATGYSRRFDLVTAQRLLLATHVEGETLSASHGFPLRLVAPGERGYHWVKWVTEIELSERSPWWQPPLPLQ